MQWRVLLGKTKLVENIIKTQSLSHKLVLNEVGRFFFTERTLLKPLMWHLQWKLHSVQCTDAARIFNLWNAMKSKSNCLYLLFLAWEWATMTTTPLVRATLILCPVNGWKAETPVTCPGPPAAVTTWRTSWGDLCQDLHFLFKICLFSWCSTVTQKKHYLDPTWLRTLCYACPKELFHEFKLRRFVFSHTVIPPRHYFTTWDNEP